jgi:O-antigen/teichoic acid export membrane protein
MPRRQSQTPRSNMSIVRNSAWNVVGVVIPSLFVIPSLAIYSRALGVELLGVLTLTFSIVGYATSFDFGLSRALIRQVSIHIDDKGAVKTYMGTTAAFVGVISLVIAAVTWLGSPWLSAFLSVSLAHRSDATAGFYWLSLSIPPYLLSLVATAYFEGKEDFRALNEIRCAASALNALAGVACVYWHPTLASVMAALCVSRWLSCLAVFVLYRWDVNRHDLVVRPAILTFDAGALRSSLSYGGWLTVSNVIGPVMSYFDRFALSHLAGAQTVAFYTVPAEVISRLSLIPVAISKALFPRLSKGHHTAAADRRIGFLLTIAGAALTIVPVFAFAGDILRLWMGPAFGGQPATVLRVLLVGFSFLSLSFGPFTDLQARGHSKTTAFIHAVELLPYLGALILLTHLYGIVGTAIVWSARTFVDYVLMVTYSRRLSHTDTL